MCEKGFGFSEKLDSVLRALWVCCDAKSLNCELGLPRTTLKGSADCPINHAPGFPSLEQGRWREWAHGTRCVDGMPQKHEKHQSTDTEEFSNSESRPAEAVPHSHS